MSSMPRNNNVLLINRKGIHMTEKILGITLLLLSLLTYSILFIIGKQPIIGNHPSFTTCRTIFSITFFALGIFQFYVGVNKSKDRDFLKSNLDHNKSERDKEVVYEK